MKNDDLSPTRRLEELGLVLPPLRQPIANFLPFKRHGSLLFLSGQGPVTAGGIRHCGTVGNDVGVEDAYNHARLATLNLLAAAHAALGSIDRIAEIVKVLGLVNAAPDFKDHPAVINGCSDLLISVFGQERGTHARSAVGVSSLPSHITVELEMIVSITVD